MDVMARFIRATQTPQRWWFWSTRMRGGLCKT
jgi:hypothetical protein